MEGDLRDLIYFLIKMTIKNENKYNLYEKNEQNINN